MTRAAVSILLNNVNGLRAWAKNRISCCDAVLTGRAGDVTGKEAIERSQEKQTLEVVLRLLNEGHT